MTDFHSLNIAACVKHLHSSLNGLTEKQVVGRFARFGKNELPKKKSLSRIAIFISQFNNALIYILLFTGVLSFAIKAINEAWVIFGAVAINVLVGYFQENKANNAIAKLKEMVEHSALVLRDGKDIMIDSADVTVGDIILIRAGNRVSADARLIDGADLLVDEAMLTGESMPSHKKIDLIPRGAAMADRENMVYAGTMVVSGLGRAMVTAIGEHTEIGKIAGMVKETKEEKTPLQLRLARFSRLLAMMFGVICAAIVIAGIARGHDLFEMLRVGAAVGVASIPEGLVVSVTFILALGMQRILKKKALTRKLIAAETLGSTTVICSDKTGTLTEGKMHVAHIIIGEREYEIKTMGSRQEETEAKAASLALQAGMMCNDAIIENPQDELGSWRFIGTPTEIALLSAAVQSGLDRDKLLETEPRVDELPFNSERKYMLSLHSLGRRHYKLYEKGAPEKLLARAVKYYHLGKEHKLNHAGLARLKKTYEALTGSGLRVIGLATREIKRSVDEGEFIRGEIEWEDVNRELTFIGFIAIKDPLRGEAKETIAIAKSAGIRPVLITGDHQLTAKAIAKEVGLPVGSENIIIGSDLENVSDEDLVKLVKKIDIYARVSPHHKLRIVKALQKRGEVVAMTGDGINDSPALKAADIGISLGTGTDIAKETSDIVLLDNNFKTIVSAIKQGRVIFKNIRKVITYLISDSLSEIALIVGSILFNTPLAILPAQILWINIVNDGLPHFSLAFERDHGEVMKEKPTRKDEPLLTNEMKTIIFGVGLIRDILLFCFFYYLYLKWQTRPEMMQYLVTLMFIILGVKSLMSIFSLRSFGRHIWQYNPFKNKYMAIAVSVSFSLLLLSVYWPPLRDLLCNSPLIDARAWMIAFTIGFINILLIEAVKIFYMIPKKLSAKN
ncbi:cation-transporting P-type ATPase [Candidatus Parcubacteria bacterium]|nr:cation-transporting P-type ATPase [Candidatus Parcubacteria bacterium]